MKLNELNLDPSLLADITALADQEPMADEQADQLRATPVVAQVRGQLNGIFVAPTQGDQYLSAA